MPEEIRKPSILRGLTERLGIQPGAVAVRRWLSPGVMPVTQMDALLEDAHIDRQIQNLVTSSYITYWTIPVKKRWRIIGIFRPATLGNCQLVFNCDPHYMYMEPDGTSAVLFNLGRDWVLKEGVRIQMKGGADAGDTSVVLTILYIEEDAY